MKKNLLQVKTSDEEFVGLYTTDREVDTVYEEIKQLSDDNPDPYDFAEALERAGFERVFVNEIYV